MIGQSDDDLSLAIRFLRDSGACRGRNGTRPILEHFLGVRRLLSDWQAEPHVQRAGLFHALYIPAVETGVRIPDTLRRRVRELIGERAETLLPEYSTAVCSPMTQRPGPEVALLLAANLVEQVEAGTADWLSLRRVHEEAVRLMVKALRAEFLPGNHSAIQALGELLCRS